MFKRNLLLLTETFPPSVGGMQQYLSGLWDALPPEAAHVIAPEVSDAALWDAECRYHIVRTPMRGWTYPRWRPALSTLRIVVRNARPDVLVCGKALFEGRAARILSRERGLPYVVLTYAMEIREWLSSWKSRRDLLTILRGAARVVVINADTKRLLVEHGIPEGKLVKIYPGVDADAFRDIPGVPEFRARIGGEGKRVMVSVCRLVARKGVDTILTALPRILQEVPDLLYVVVGDGLERSDLEELADTLGVNHAVRFLGAQSREDVLRALRVADLFVLTPRQVGTDVEGFGIAYLEAAAAGRTAVGSMSGGVPEAVVDGTTGLLVRPGDAAETAAAIIRLLQDDGLRARLAEAAQRRVEQEFRWPRRALLFQGMIESILQEQQRTRT